jgi:hypothetical protein
MGNIFVQTVSHVKHIYICELLSEWLFYNANSTIVQLYHVENKLIVNEMMMRSVLY